MNSCPFCTPETHGEQHIILENEHCRFLRKAQPVLEGAGVIVPKAHREMVFDLTPAEWTATFALLREAKALLDRLHHPRGYNIGWNCGRAAGQQIPHAHLHVIPRFEDEPLAGSGIRYGLKDARNTSS